MSSIDYSGLKKPAEYGDELGTNMERILNAQEVHENFLWAVSQISSVISDGAVATLKRFYKSDNLENEKDVRFELTSTGLQLNLYDDSGGFVTTICEFLFSSGLVVFNQGLTFDSFQIGSPALLYNYSYNAVISPSKIIAGSYFRFTNVYGSFGGTPSGSWRSCGYSAASSGSTPSWKISVYIRVA